MLVLLIVVHVLLFVESAHSFITKALHVPSGNLQSVLFLVRHAFVTESRHCVVIIVQVLLGD